MENLAYKTRNHHVAIWLFVCCFFIFLMVGIGGLTRLTESGLSITQWKPVRGIIPPFSESAWQEEFSQYQLSPEYLKKNIGMSLDEFKGIFWLEFIHRLVGRITGLVFLVPLIYFFTQRSINRSLALKLVGVFSLGGMQGVVGWYMVKSGLQDAPHVSHLWLAFHLGMAFIIYALIFWFGLSLYKKKKAEYSIHNHKITFLSSWLPVLIFAQVIFGAFVAGMHAGLMYNTFPSMNGQFIPDGILIMSPWYMNFIDNATTIQFTHRAIAYIIAIYVLYFNLISVKFSLTINARCAIYALLFVVILQISLGILTLLWHVPVILASLHQMVALVLFTISLFIKYELKKNC